MGYSPLSGLWIRAPRARKTSISWSSLARKLGGRTLDTLRNYAARPIPDFQVARVTRLGSASSGRRKVISSRSVAQAILQVGAQGGCEGGEQRMFRVKSKHIEGVTTAKGIRSGGHASSIAQLTARGCLRMRKTESNGHAIPRRLLAPPAMKPARQRRAVLRRRANREPSGARGRHPQHWRPLPRAEKNPTCPLAALLSAANRCAAASPPTKNSANISKIVSRAGSARWRREGVRWGSRVGLIFFLIFNRAGRRAGWVNRRESLIGLRWHRRTPPSGSGTCSVKEN